MMKGKLNPSMVFDIDPKTSALILGSKRLEDYATKYLREHCPEALEEPMPLPVEQILDNERLTVQKASLSQNLDVFGCCFLLDGNVDVFDRRTGQSISTFFPAGTILVDPESEWMYGEGSRRNTLMHEAIHWEKDRAYFKVLQLKNYAGLGSLYPIMCRRSKKFYEPAPKKRTKESQIEWLEWQAHRLAPRILMPYAMFRKKAVEFLRTTDSCDSLVENLGDFFIVSRSSVKYRLTEVGLQGEIASLKDYEDVYADMNHLREYVALTEEEAHAILLSNPLLKSWVDSLNLLFVDGYFVIPDRKYVAVKSGKVCLTERALRNLSKCVLNIREYGYRSYRNSEKDYEGCAYLNKCKIGDVDGKILIYHPNFQPNFSYEPNDAYAAAYNEALANPAEDKFEDGLINMVNDRNNSLCQILWYIMQNRGMKYPASFNEATGLHKNYFYKIKTNQYDGIGKSNLLLICVAAGLTSRLTEEVFKRAGIYLSYYNNPDRMYLRILDKFAGISVMEFNSLLLQGGYKELRTVSRDED